MTNEVLYEIAKLHRDRIWDDQIQRFGDWEPDDAQRDAAPHGDPHRWWYLQGKAEAYAAIMSELESVSTIR